MKEILIHTYDPNAWAIAPVQGSRDYRPMSGIERRSTLQRQHPPEALCGTRATSFLDLRPPLKISKLKAYRSRSAKW
jgi:hypothetical protein